MSTSQLSCHPDVNAERILSTLQGYRDAAALHTAIELELFDRIARGADTAAKLAGELDIPISGVRLLCDYLLSVGLLVNRDEQFQLPADVAVFLDKQSPSYIGNSARVLYSPLLLRGFERLTEAVRAAGAMHVPTNRSSRPEWFDAARGVLHADAAANDAAANTVAEMMKLPAGQPIKILDVFDLDSAYGIGLAIRFPQSIIVAVDFPDALRSAQAHADRAKLGTRYQHIPGDPLIVTLGSEYDAVLLASLVQYDSAQIAKLLVRLRDVLKKAGQLFILEFLMETDPEVHLFAGLRLDMLAAAPGTRIYPPAQIQSVLANSGFHSIEARPVPSACATLISARS